MRTALTTILLLATAPALADPVVTSFDVPGATFTIVTAISPAGIVAGNYGTAAGPCQLICGFIRTPDGTITTFSIGDNGLGVTGVNDNGAVVGFYAQNSQVRGFLRAPDGTVTKIGGRHNNFTYAEGINQSGIVMGEIGHDFSAEEGFVRMPDGTMTRFKGTHCHSIETYDINTAGAVAGSCDGMNTASGFVRQPDGTISTFKPPGKNETYAIAIDDSGTVAGFFFPKHQSGASGFVRDPDGTLHPYNFPSDFGSFGLFGIALVGGDRQTVGDAFIVSEKLWHGWIRHDDGTFETFRVDQGTQPNMGTLVAGITPSGVIAGYYKNDDGVIHGYIRTP